MTCWLERIGVWVRGLTGWPAACLRCRRGACLGFGLRAPGLFPGAAGGFRRCCPAAGGRRQQSPPVARGYCRLGLRLWPVFLGLALDRLRLHGGSVRASLAAALRHPAPPPGLRSIPALPARWRFTSGRTARPGFWFLPCFTPPANGCAAIASPVFLGICRPIAGAPNWRFYKVFGDWGLWPFFPDGSSGRQPGGFQPSRLQAAAGHDRDYFCVCGRSARSGWRHIPRLRALCLVAARATGCSAEPEICPPPSRAQLAAAFGSFERSGPVTHIIWPEAAPPFLLDRSAVALDEIALLTGDNPRLITGAVRAERPRWTDPPFYNSLYHLRAGRQARCRSTTNSIWCRSANMCPSPALLNRIGITKLTEGQTGFPPAMARISISSRRARCHAADLLRDYFSRRGDGRPAARLAGQCHRRFLVRALGRALCSIF